MLASAISSSFLSGRSAPPASSPLGGDEEEDPELVAASRGAADASAAAAPQLRGRNAASMSLERSADRSLDELEDASAHTTGSLKKVKKEKSKSGLLKGLFGSNKHKV